MKDWYKKFFDKFYLLSYREIIDKKRTLQEINFIEKVLELNKDDKILDLCCGHGRHSIELAKRGYNVTAQDLNRYFLKLAKKQAEKEGVRIRFVCKDMRIIPFRNEFDAIFNIFTSFGYLESDEEDFKVIKQVSKALKRGGKFLLDIRNPYWLINNFQYQNWRIVNDLVVLEERQLDFFSGRVISQVFYFKKGKKRKKTGHYTRIYTLAEINNMLKMTGLTIKKVYGDFDFNDYSLNSPRMIILSIKP